MMGRFTIGLLLSHPPHRNYKTRSVTGSFTAVACYPYLRLEPDARQPQDLVLLEPHRAIKRLGYLGGLRDVLRQQAAGWLVGRSVGRSVKAGEITLRIIMTLLIIPR